MQLLWLIPSLAIGLYFGLANGMWQMALMSLASVLVAIVIQLARRPKAQFEMRITAKRVLVNGRRISRFSRLWPKAWRLEYERQVQELIASAKTELIKTRADPLSFIAGFDFELSLLDGGPHLFLVGPTGSGKSRWLEQLLRTISGEPRLLLADYKGGVTLGQFGHVTTDLDTKESRHRFWQELIDLLDERERYLVLHRATFWRQTSLRPIVVVVDELAHTLRSDSLALTALSSAAARGRSLGVHLVLASQSVSGVPRELLVNLNLRVILAGTDEVDAMQLGAKAKPPRICSQGAGLVVGGAEFRFPFRQVPILGLANSSREQ